MNGIVDGQRDVGDFNSIRQDLLELVPADDQGTLSARKDRVRRSLDAGRSVGEREVSGDVAVPERFRVATQVLKLRLALGVAGAFGDHHAVGGEDRTAELTKIAHGVAGVSGMVSEPVSVEHLQVEQVAEKQGEQQQQRFADSARARTKAGVAFGTRPGHAPTPGKRSSSAIGCGAALACDSRTKMATIT